MPKSTPDEIRRRFDNDVERFSNLETGQSATVDAPLGLELIAGAAAAVNPGASALLDIGCGAGNYSLKLMERLPLQSVTLVDLSRPMLDRAVARIGDRVAVTAFQGDIRETPLRENAFDVAVAGATLHHLREDEEWDRVFGAVFRSLRNGASFWIWDLVAHEHGGVHDLMWRRYGESRRTQRTGLSGSGVRLRRGGGHAASADVAVGAAPARGIRDRRGVAQERLLRGIRRFETGLLTAHANLS
jgi:tRNA (cmo5U34)-methyltransferase